MLRKSLVAGFVVALMSSATFAQEVPTHLWPPPGSVSAGVYSGKGEHIYVCSLVGSAFQWTWRAPSAILSSENGEEFGEYSFGPSFQARDGSRLVATIYATAPAPRPGAIGWYLAPVASSTGNGALTGVRAVQQLNTVGGLVSGSCATLGEERRAPFSADYLFWR